MENCLKFSDTRGGRGGVMNLGHGDDLDEGVGNTVKVKQLGRWRVFLGLGRILFQLYLFDFDPDMGAVFRRNAVVVEQIYVAVFRERFCLGIREERITNK